MKIVSAGACILLMGAVLPALARTVSGPGIAKYNELEVSPRKYSFRAWPKGQDTAVRFISSLYVKDGASQVRIDEGKLFPKQDDSPVRTVEDFDSLQASKQASAYNQSSSSEAVWYKARVIGSRWVFPRFNGAISIYSGEPGRGAYVYMDTGAGLEPYSESAVRAKISTHPQSARLLRREKTGTRLAWAMGWTGLGLVGAGTVANLITDGAGTPLILGGLGIAAFSWVPHFQVQDRYDLAIRAYNEDAPAR